MQPAVLELVQEAASGASACEEKQGADLYDLADELLSELIPGWDELDDDVNLVCNDEHPAVEALAKRCEDRASREDDVQVLDASYRACVREAERYLVQCEGFSPDDEVVRALRVHLHRARAKAVRVHRGASRSG